MSTAFSIDLKFTAQNAAALAAIRALQRAIDDLANDLLRATTQASALNAELRLRPPPGGGSRVPPAPRPAPPTPPSVPPVPPSPPVPPGSDGLGAPNASWMYRVFVTNWPSAPGPTSPPLPPGPRPPGGGVGAGSAAGIMSTLQNLIVAVGGLTVLTSAVGIADRYASLNARVKLATKSYDEQQTAMQELYVQAQRNRSPLEDTINLYARLAPSVREVGGTQYDTLQLTNVFTRSLALSGATATESGSAILQFSQALGAGRLGGEEFNAVNEAAPRFMQALADSLGKPRGALKALAEQGKLTPDVLLKAARDSAQKIDEEFKSLPITVDGALTQLRNAYTKYVGELNQSGQYTQVIVEFIQYVADHLPEILEAVARIGVLMLTWYSAMKMTEAVQGFIALYARIMAATGAMGLLQRASLVLFAFIAGWQLGAYLRDNFKMARDAGIAFIGAILNGISYLKQGFELLGPSIRFGIAFAFDTIKGLAADFFEFFANDFAKLPEAMGGAISATLREVSVGLRSELGKEQAKVGDEIAAINAKRTAERNQIDENIIDQMAASDPQAKKVKPVKPDLGTITGGKGKDKKKDKKDKAAEEAERAAADAAKSQVDELKQVSDDWNAALEEMLKNDQIALSVFLASKTENVENTARTQIEVLEARYKVAGDKEKVEIEKQIKDIETLRAKSLEDIERSRADYAQKGAEAERQIRLDTLKAQGQDVEIALEEIQARYAKRLQEMRRSGIENAEAQIAALRDIDINKAQAQDIESRSDKVRKKQDRAEKTVDRQLKGGEITPEQARQQRQLIFEQTRKEFAELLIQAENLSGELGLDLVEKLKGLEQAIPKLKTPFQELGETIKNSIQSRLQNTFESVVTGAETAKDAFKSFAKAVIADLQRMAAQEAIKKIFEAFGGQGGNSSPATSGGNDGGGFFASLASLFGGGKADGGYIKGAGTATSDSIPTLLSNGEFVIKASSVDKFGVGFLNALNAGNLPKYATGGLVGNASNMGMVAMGGTTIEIHNYGNQPVREERKTGDNGKELVRLFIGEAVRDVNSNGPLHKSISDTFGINRKGRA
jgi:tape measure domain-containing protein